MRVIPLALGVLLVSRPALPQAPDVDEERAAWAFRRRVSVARDGGDQAASIPAHPAFASVKLPPELAARTHRVFGSRWPDSTGASARETNTLQRDLHDLRLVGPDGREVPYVIDRVVERESTPRWPGRLVDTRRETRVASIWVVDLGEPRSFDRLEVDVRQQDFAKRFRIESSDDGQAWRTLLDDAPVFDRPWRGAGGSMTIPRVRHTSLALPHRARARYVRLTTDDRRSRPVEVLGVTASASRKLAGDAWSRAAALRRLGTVAGVSRYRLDAPSGFPLESLALEADDAVFARRVVVREEGEVNGRRQDRVLADGSLYRLRLEDEALSGAGLELAVRRPDQALPGGELVVEVHDDDSPPLRNPRATISAAATRLIFPPTPESLTLYYGNDATRAPLYDIDRLKDRIRLDLGFVEAVLGAETANPRFRKVSRLAFAPTRAAPLDASQWRAVRRLSVTGAEDLYTLTLAAEDIGRLRPDLGDLRLVDEADRQVPYVLEAAASESKVALRIEDVTAGRTPAPRALSRYRLAVPEAGGSGHRPGLPLSSLELGLADTFFARPARLLATAPGRARSQERLLYSGVLTRTTRHDGAARPESVEIALDGSPVGAMTLEIQEGDNAPLRLVEARGVVRVPRLAFDAGPGPYRVLMGNPEARAPRYDIATLRQEILSYSALPAQAAPAEPNPAFRRLARDYFQQAPPTVLLWTTLLLAVIALLLLTARIVRSSPD